MNKRTVKMLEDFIKSDSKVLCLVGYSGSGKTTLSESIAEKYPDVEIFHGDEVYKSLRETSNLRLSSDKEKVLEIFEWHLSTMHGKTIIEDKVSITGAWSKNWQLKALIEMYDELSNIYELSE